MQLKPNFLIIGAPKAGTTSLWANLREHPNVFMPKIKEPHYFSREEVYLRGWSWYMDLFSEWNGEFAVGEASPSYSMIQSYPKVAERIANNLPDVRLIYIVRNPFERVQSAWLQFLFTGHPITGDFDQDIRGYGPMIEQSLYWQCISKYREYFSDQNILVLFFEDLKSDAKKVIRKCYSFLGVDTDFVPVNTNYAYNESAGRRKERNIMSLLRKSPFYFAAKNLPEGIREWIYDVFGKKRLPGKPCWKPKVKEWYAEIIYEDICNFLDYTGKPKDYWF